MADQKRDYYEVLGVDKSASKDDIKKAYRKLAKENHPDLHPGDKACEERFKEANEAYEILSDDEKRQKYDQFGHAAFDPNAGYGAGAGGFDFGDLGDIFGDIFGGGFGGGFGGFSGSSRRADPNAPRKGSDVRASLNISFEEAAFSLDTGAISEVIETEYGYHILKCISDFDLETTQTNKIALLQKRKEEIFDETYDEFVSSISKSLNEKLYASIIMIHNDEVTTSSFFDVDF